MTSTGRADVQHQPVTNAATRNTHPNPARARSGLRDALFRTIDKRSPDRAVVECATAVAEHVRGLGGVLGDVALAAQRDWFGRRPIGSPAFLGRLATFWELHSALHAGEFRPITDAVGPGVAQVVGLAGVGKTMLAEEYALRFGGAYPGGVFWLSAREGAQDRRRGRADAQVEVGQQVRGLAVELGLPAKSLKRPEEVKVALVAELERRSTPHLWIVDDLPDNLSADELREWLAPHRLGKTLITTRSHRYQAIARTVSLTVLPKPEAIELLTRHRHPLGGDEAKEAEQLCDDLGCHPLATVVAAAAVREGAGSTPYTDFRAALRDTADDVLDFAADLVGVLPTGHEPNIARALLASVEGLDESAVDLLRLASVLANAPIPWVLIDASFAQADVIEEREARRRGMRARHDVFEASLAERLGEIDELTVHPLVTRVVRFADRGEPGRPEQLRRAVAQAIVLALQDEQRVNPLSGQDRLMVHARHVAETMTSPELELLEVVADYDHKRGAQESARQMREAVVRARRDQRGDDAPETLIAELNLSVTLRSLGHFSAALELQQKVLTGRREVQGPDHEASVEALVHVAHTLYARGDRAAARELEEEVLTKRLERHGEDDIDTLAAMESLALTERSLGGIDRSRSLLEQVVEGRRALLGEGHPQTVDAIANLAWTLHLQGELGVARRLEEQVHAERQKLYGEGHPKTLMALGNLGATLGAQGDTGTALVLQRQMVLGQRQLFGDNHPDTLRGMINLSDTLFEWGELGEARAMQEHVVTARKAILGRADPYTLRAESALARTLAAQGELEAAHASLTNVLKHQRALFGDRHLDTLLTLERLALVLQGMSDIHAARNLQELVVATRRDFQGTDHPETLAAADALAKIVNGDGTNENA